MISSEFLLRPELEKSYQRRSATITTVIMILLLLIAFFIILGQPKPDFPEEGILISLGNTETGSGVEEPQQQEEVTPPPPAPAPQQSEEVVEEVNVTQDVNSTAVDLKKDQEKQEKPVEQPTPQEQPVQEPVQAPEQPKEQPQEKPKYTFNPNASNQQSNSTSQGNDPMSSGNMGNPNGDPNSPNMGETPGLGNSGVAYDLGGRGARSLPTPERKARKEQGKIILEIFVDRDGNVVRVGDLLRGTEVTDPAMIQEARQLASKCRFEPDPNAPGVQRGTISINFKY